mmetsp:Transcript_1205/g.2230  ORF Transcript_1205/g.2230 Transcript_1205/m.2230 type:complete len:248 (-) Transcript_1205:430-1173(-)|eukprot:CAMPEP_0182452414 /NCGR_PEP_ID=MMETSP1172-20130603/44236_1 /TAXON_ID=708627 /ORGANISM="Timspurckia oligopyrenoides, Strain CCMP3278" /LENGTH=247 /DNA_ID=CAMNT_0024650245 /DNA_START=206 /DNA_END=949 /DNA_ORIENTATION=+
MAARPAGSGALSPPPGLSKGLFSPNRGVDRNDVLSHSDDEYEPENISEDNSPELPKMKGPLPRGNSAIFFRPLGDTEESDLQHKGSGAASDTFAGDGAVQVNDESALTSQENLDQRTPRSGKDQSNLNSGSFPDANSLTNRAKTSVPANPEPTGKLPGMSKSLAIPSGKKRDGMNRVASSAKTGKERASAPVDTSEKLSGLRRSVKPTVDSRELSRENKESRETEHEPEETKKKGMSKWLKKHFAQK